MLYLIRIILSNMFRLVIRASSGCCSYYKNKFVVSCVTIRLAHHTYNTSPTLWSKTHHITALFISPQTLNTFTSPSFSIFPLPVVIFTLCINNYPTRCNSTPYIYICKLLYLFRVVFSPIFSSSYHCIYSICKFPSRHVHYR